MLGAGLDTFAYRHPDLAVRVYEVDQPETQQYKRERLAAAGIAEPASVIYVSVDFEHQHLDEQLVAAGFNLDEPAFFSWLGVVYYLGTDAINNTLRFIGARPTGTELVFDYMDPNLPDAVPSSRVTDAVGEPILSKFTPEHTAHLVAQAGLQIVRDLSPADAANRYFTGRVDGTAPTGNSHVIHAVKASNDTVA